jgi:beta-glucosidase
MKKVLLLFSCCLLSIACYSQSNQRMNEFISSLMKKMTLEEKIGQTILSGGGIPGYNGKVLDRDEAIRKGYIGATSVGYDYNAALQVQKAVDQSRLKIPVLIGLDVIHGYHTIFPIPLASASSWNLQLIEKSARVAADEATSFGVNWTWSPMVDICRDARWGRIAEGAGEDPFLGAKVAAAMVKGYQGNDLKADNTILSCVKHFAIYGAAEGGRDYNTCDMSKVSMYNYYLPPYKAAIDAGVGTAMSSFNVVDGVPATGNHWLLTELLRNQWHFKGFVVSDAGSIGEMSNHGMGDEQRVGELAMNAGTDMDLGGGNYSRTLKKAVEDKKIPLSVINTACRRILEIKYKLGLFDDPYRYLKAQDRQAHALSNDNLNVARQLADESIVLLKNAQNVLPLRVQGKIAVVGPMGNTRGQLIGTWANASYTTPARSVFEALKETVGNNGSVVYSQGSNFTEEENLYDGSFKTPTDSLIQKAIQDVSDADVIVATVGEPASWSGEARSRVNPSLPECQKRMLKALYQTGKPVVVVVMSGRPLILTDEDKQYSTILEAWHGGTMAGYALSDVLLGKVNPSGKLTTTFPRFVGQIPIYYNSLNTGRPLSDFWATSKYIDCNNKPLYPFGYGLSYTTYSYGKLAADKTQLKGDNDCLHVNLTITNTGNYDGKEIVQLYIGDPAASISRPVKELKGFQKIEIAKGESKNVTFNVTTDLLKFYNSQLKYDWEDGDFNISVGPDSSNLQTIKIHWSK